MSDTNFEDLRAFYRLDEPVDVTNLPAGTTRVRAERADGAVEERRDADGAHFAALSSGTYCVVALNDDGDVLGEEFTTVGAHPGERPVHGFATSFGEGDVAEILRWHQSLRSTVVQVYDWMATYTEPLGPEHGWEDPSHRAVSLRALRELSAGWRALGAVSHAYAPIYAVGNDFAVAHPEMLLYDDEGRAIRFLDQIVLANPANEAWQRHFAASYGEAMDAVGFDGLHVDTYGYPRVAFDVDGVAVNPRAAYEAFLVSLRAQRPHDLISFNQVNGVPSAAVLPAGPGFRYCEVWPPNDEWRHFEGLLDRSAGVAGRTALEPEREVTRGSIACYPPVWRDADDPVAMSPTEREGALRTVVLTEAVATSLGASALLYGDLTGVLRDPYYPKREPLRADEGTTVLAWRRFALRTRDLFFDGEDTSWYEVRDENGAVSVDAAVPVNPEPLGGGLFARVVHGLEFVAVSLVDLSGSAHARWTEPSARGHVTTATVRVLLDTPEEWRVEAAVLGGGDRFRNLRATIVAHRQGRALEVELPIVDGWSVLRVLRGVDDGA